MEDLFSNPQIPYFDDSRGGQSNISGNLGISQL